MATGIVVGSVLLAADQQLGVEELAVGAGADLVDGRRVEVDEDGPGHIFAIAGLGEEGLERARVADVLGVGIRATIGTEAVLQEIAFGGDCELNNAMQRCYRVVSKLTAPRHCYRAGYQPGPDERGGPGRGMACY